ncbi:MAG TPA: geranylgeranyl reductase family protein [Burkholderiales bacterium]|nr:geranylgeranyl reductase family protein [Burkholderiales bacterium]
MSALTCDVLVVGLGPAGGAAAAAAAKLGLRVVGVEKKRVVGVPVQCAEFIPLPLGRHARAPGVMAQRVSAMKSVLPSGWVHAAPFSGLMIDRSAFDQALAHAAEEAGARLFLASRLVALDVKSRLAQIGNARRSVEISWQVLIAADGPHSVTAALLGLPPLKTVNTRQYTVPLPNASMETAIWLSDAYPGGYAWLFPKGSVANLGLGMDPGFAVDLKRPLDQLHRQLLHEGRVGREILFRTGGAIPVGGLRQQLVVESVVFTGDAAGLTHPISGAGIGAAVISGERAAEAAHALLHDGASEALAGYEEDIRDQFEGSIARGLARRRELERAAREGAARHDAVQRRGWIGFPEYFDEEATCDAPV